MSDILPPEITHNRFSAVVRISDGSAFIRDNTMGRVFFLLPDGTERASLPNIAIWTGGTQFLQYVQRIYAQSEDELRHKIQFESEKHGIWTLTQLLFDRYSSDAPSKGISLNIREKGASQIEEFIGNDDSIYQWLLTCCREEPIVVNPEDYIGIDSPKLISILSQFT